MKYFNHESLPCNILLFLRGTDGLTFQGILKALRIDDFRYASMHYEVADILDRLAAAGLIDVPGKGERLYGYDLWRDGHTITISPQWERIQTALGISLTQFALYDPRASLIVSPLFGRPRKLEPSKSSDIFVLMPFLDTLRPVYDDHIKAVAKQLTLSVKRADDFFTSESIMQDIWAGINGARVIIADCTGRNPNVFYEVGLAHTLGKPVILVTQSSADVPSDLRSFRYIEYQLTPRGMIQFERALSETVSSVLAEDE